MRLVRLRGGRRHRFQIVDVIGDIIHCVIRSIVPGSRQILFQLTLYPARCLVALLLLAGKFFLPFLKSST